MAKATSINESSLSSILANGLVGMMGVTHSISESHVKPAIRKSTSKAFTDRVREEAGTPELWGQRSGSIQVSISDNDLVSVAATGTPEEVYEAEMLEYGTPDFPPRAVMRTYEKSFNEEYKVIMSGYDL